MKAPKRNRLPSVWQLPVRLALLFLGLGGLPSQASAGALLTNTNRPSRALPLIFIHHSTGEAWLSDWHGGLGVALRDNNYCVSDTNYGWGPDQIGDTTDMGHWWNWFRGPGSVQYLAALYAEHGQHCEYTRMTDVPEGKNRVVLFKSCFPNSALQGNPADPVPPIAANPLRGQDSGSEAHTVANAKGLYRDLLVYFSTMPDTLFVVLTAPPLSDPTWADNARAFNEWLVHEWLADYALPNVFVWDFYSVLTSNAGDPERNDLDQETGNHHRWWKGAVQHQTLNGQNVLAYASSPGDDHPNAAGDRKATAEFVALLNAAVNAWLAPHFSSIRVEQGRVRMTIGGLVEDIVYVVQGCAAPRDSSWVDLDTFVGRASTVDWTEAISDPRPMRFYRVAVP